MNTDRLTSFAPTVAVWIIGRRLIHFSVGAMQRALRRQPIEPTVIGFFGVETTRFVAGVFLMVLRPFKADDFVTVGGVSGE